MRRRFIFTLTVGIALLLGVVGCGEQTQTESEEESPYAYWCWWAKATLDLHEIDREFMLSNGLDTSDFDAMMADIEQQYHEDCSEGYIAHWGTNILELCEGAADWRQMALDADQYLISQRYAQWMQTYCSPPESE